MLFPELGLPAYSCDDLFQQRALLDGCLDGAAPRSSRRAARCRSSRSSALPLADRPSALQLRRRDSSRDASSASCPRPICPTTASSTSCASSPPADAALATRSILRGQPRDSVRQHACCSRSRNSRCSRSTSRFARTCGCRFRRRRTRRWPARPCCSISRPRNITVGKADYRRALVASQSARCLAAYLYSGAGVGESTTDLAWDGHALICRERQPARRVASASAIEPQLICAEIDLERLSQERMRQNSFGETCVSAIASALRRFRAVAFSLELAAPRPDAARARATSASPTCRRIPATRDERCAEVYEIQVQGLAKRLRATGHRARRDRRLGRARLDPRAAGLRAGDGSCSATRARTSSPTRCRASRPARARSSRRAA